MVEPTPIIGVIAPDADAVYILNRIAEADEEDRLAKQTAVDRKQHKERGREFRIEAGKRLIEVRTRLLETASDKNVSGAVFKGGRGKTNPFRDWLRATPIAEPTARRHMKLAGYTPEQRTMHRAKERDRKRTERKFRMGWVQVLMQAGVGYVETSGQGLALLRNEIKDKLGIEPPKFFTDRAEAQAFVDKVRPFRAPVPKSEEFTESQQKKIDRVIAAKLAELQASFDKVVSEAVEKRIPEALAYTEKVRLECLEELSRYKALNFNFKKQITLDEYRLLVQIFHPDRVPEDRKEQYDKAFKIVRRLQDYAEA